MMRELGPPLQSAAMTMLWVNSGAEVADDRACKTQSLYYGTNPAVARPRVKGLRISMLQAELRDVLTKKRADDADDDSGLPRSPASPPGGPLLAGRGQPGKSGGSFSDGSMLSIYSSGTGTGTEEDPFGPLSDNSSRLSLSRDQDSLELRSAGALSHAAAKHRIAVRPRRKHGASRPRRSGPSAGVPATVEEEGTVPEQSPAPPAPAQDSPHAGQGGAAGGRATLPAAGVAERTTPVQRSRSTTADGRPRALPPRRLWGRDASEPRRSEGFFSRLFGSRRSGRRRKAGGKEAEEPPQPRRDAPLEQPDSESSRAQEPEPDSVSTDAAGAEVLSRAGEVSRPEEAGAEKERKQSAAALAAAAAAIASSRDVKEDIPTPEQEEVPCGEDATLGGPGKDIDQRKEEEEKKEEEEVAEQSEGRSQGSPEVRGRPQSLLRTGSGSASEGSESPEPAEPQTPTPAVQEPGPPETVPAPDWQTPPEAAPDRHQQDQESQEQQAEEESPPVLRRRRETPEQSTAGRPSESRRSFGSQKLSWMEELQKTPLGDDTQTSSGQGLRRTFVKAEAVTTPPSGDDEVRRTPSWVKDELRKTPPSSGHELRKTWIKEQSETLPSSEGTNAIAPWAKEPARKSSPPSIGEDARTTARQVTEEIQRTSVSEDNSFPTVPLRPGRVRPTRRPLSSAGPPLSTAAAESAADIQTQSCPRPQLGPRRCASVLVLGGAEPVWPPSSGPRSLDSAALLTDRGQQRRSGPTADPALSPARLELGRDESAASSDGPSGPSGGEETAVSPDDVCVSGEGGQPDATRHTAAEVSCEGRQSVRDGTAGTRQLPEESGGEPSGVSPGGGRSESRRSLLGSLQNIPSDSGRREDSATPEDSTRPPRSLTPGRPEVPAKPRRVSETEATARPADGAPSAPAQDIPRLPAAETSAASEGADGTPEFMKVHLHRVQTSSAMTTQVVVPKPKPRETPPKAAWQLELRNARLERTAGTRAEDRTDVKRESRGGGLAADLPEVVLIERHSPRQPRSASQPSSEDHPASHGSLRSATPSGPESPRTAPETPARPVPPAASTPASSLQPAVLPGASTPASSHQPAVLPATSTPASSHQPPVLPAASTPASSLQPAVLPAASTPASSLQPAVLPAASTQLSSLQPAVLPAASTPASSQQVEDSEPVVLRRRPPTASLDSSPDSELLKVFKRRSLKTVSPDEPAAKLSTPGAPASEGQQSDRPGAEVALACVSPSAARAAWNQRSISVPVAPPSPGIRDTGPPSSGPVEAPLTGTERPRRPAAAAGRPASGEPGRPGAAEEAAPTADWLRLVRERREQREQREQDTRRQPGPEQIVIQPETGRGPAPRSSRVLEMASSFQKLQPT